MIPVNPDGTITFTDCFGKQKTEKPEYIMLNNKTVAHATHVDEVLECDRPEDYYALMSPQLRTKFVAVFSRRSPFKF